MNSIHSQTDICRELINCGQIVGRALCHYHAAGGLKSLPCDTLDDDGPVYKSILSGTRVRADGHQGAWKVLRCEGDCDWMVVVLALRGRELRMPRGMVHVLPKHRDNVAIRRREERIRRTWVATP